MALFDIGVSGRKSTILSGEVQASTTGNIYVYLGFKPNVLVLETGTSFEQNPPNILMFYNEDFDSSSFVTCISTSTGFQKTNLPNTDSNRLASIDDTGFAINKVSSANTHIRYYVLQ